MTTAGRDRPRAVVVGDVGLDVLAALAGPIVPGQETRGRVGVGPGGAGGNTASWLARCGVDVTLIARVGADEAGRTAEAELTAAGVRCLFAVDPVLPTCCVVVLVEAGGERTMVSDRGANAALSAADVNLPVDVPSGRADRSDGGGHLHLSGYVLLDDRSRTAGLAALAAARSAGWTSSVDPQSAAHVEGAGAARFLEWVDCVDLLLPNDSELDALGGPDAVLTAVGAIAVTHGARGASWISADERIDVPAPAAHRTDSTGAGDAFNAGLLASWLAGAGPRAALLAGVGTGTAAAARLGARPAAG